MFFKSIAVLILIFSSASSWAHGFKGAWISDCTDPGKYSSFGARGRRTSYAVDGIVIRTDEFYADSQCSTKVAELKAFGTMQITSSLYAEDFDWVDFHFVSVAVTLYSENLVHFANRTLIASCGIDDWKLGEIRSITNHIGRLGCPLPYHNSLFTLIRLNGDRLNLGERDDAHDGFTPETRPVQLDLERPYRLR